MRLKKTISFIMALLLLSMTFVGCSVMRYDAEIYSYVNDWLDPTFFESNRLGGVDYRNPDYDDAEAEAADLEGLEYEIPQYFRYPDNPSTRTFIITDEEIFNLTFAENTIEVDFEKEMVLLYMFASWQPSRSDYYGIDKIEVEGEAITVYFSKDHNDSRKKDSVYPYPRSIAVKMKKVDVTTVNFEYIRGG